MTQNIMPWRKRKNDVSRVEQTPFTELHQRMDDLFSEFFDGFGTGLSRFEPRHTITPSVDVSETDEEVRVTADLPGMEEKDIQVSLDNDLLTIKGEKKQEQEEKKRNYYMVERSYGEFQRVIPVPASVDKEKVKAAFKKGVLTITLPKTAELAPKKKTIEIVAE